MKTKKAQSPSSHPLEEHPAYVQAIGMVCLEEVALELRLSLLLARLLAIPLRTANAIYLTPKAEQTRLDILRNVAHAHLSVSPSAAKSALGKQKTKARLQINKLIERAETLVRKRHRVVHDEWNFSDKEQTITRRLIDGRSPEHMPTDFDELKQLIFHIDDIFDLSVEFKDHPPIMANLRKTA